LSDAKENLRIKESLVGERLPVSYTLTGLRWYFSPHVLTALDDLITALQDVEQEVVATARTYAQSFTNVFGERVPPSYIDLGHFALLLQEESDSDEVRAAADQLLHRRRANADV
jgi:hypothetical protein